MTQKNIKLFSTSGDVIDSAEYSADFRAAEKVGPFWVGELAFYYRDGLRKYCIPLAVIDRAFTRIQEVNTHTCCSNYSVYIYRLVLCSAGAEIADIRTEDEKLVLKAQELLSRRIPGLAIGFVKPA